MLTAGDPNRPACLYLVLTFSYSGKDSSVFVYIYHLINLLYFFFFSHIETARNSSTLPALYLFPTFSLVRPAATERNFNPK